MFVEPDSSNSQCATKSDPTATARSTIRRQRTIRHATTTALNNQHGDAQISLRRPHPNAGRRSPRLDRTTLLEDIRRRGRISVTHPSGRSQQNDDHEPEIAHSQGVELNDYIVDPIVGPATHRSRVEIEAMHEARNRAWTASQRRERDVLVEERPSSSQRGSRSYESRNVSLPSQTHLPPSEIGVVYGAENFSQPAARPSPRRSVRRAGFTPGFAPAHRVMSTELAYSQRLVGIARLSNQVRDLQSASVGGQDALELSTMLRELNVMMTRASASLSSRYLESETRWIDAIQEQIDSIRCRSSITAEISSSRNTARYGEHTRQSLLRDHPTSLRAARDDSDGLGDRLRSVSPEPVSWETMLATITPDDQVPSTQSSFASTNASTSNAHSFADSNSTAPSTVQESEPCPTMENPDLNVHGEHRVWDEVDGRFTPEPDPPTPGLPHVNAHLDRIESLSRRLRHQRSQGDFMARHQRIVEREAELQRLEMTLQRLERQLEDERQSGINNARTSNSTIRGRGRL